MKLAVSAWYPHRHQATALEQLIAHPTFQCVPLEDVPAHPADSGLGPFLALLDDGCGQTVVGYLAIVETLHREHPDWNLIGTDPLSRSRARTIANRIEECFSRLCLADLASHEHYPLAKWSGGSAAPTRLREEACQTLAVIEQMVCATPHRFIAGARPSMADALLAALTWTFEDYGLSTVFAEHQWLLNWRARNCSGSPFARSCA